MKAFCAHLDPPPRWSVGFYEVWTKGEGGGGGNTVAQAGSTMVFFVRFPTSFPSLGMGFTRQGREVGGGGGKL